MFFFLFLRFFLSSFLPLTNSFFFFFVWKCKECNCCFSLMMMMMMLFYIYIYNERVEDQHVLSPSSFSFSLYHCSFVHIVDHLKLLVLTRARADEIKPSYHFVVLYSMHLPLKSPLCLLSRPLSSLVGNTYS